MSPVALRHGAGVEQETTGPDAYDRFPESQPTQYGEGWLPDP